MTPLVRIVCLLIFAAGIARAALPGLLVGVGLLVVVSLWIGGHPWIGITVLLRRIRWLLVSLVVIYGWFTPGPAMVSLLGPLSPNISGLYEGLLRITALILMVAAVHLLLKATDRAQLLSALHQLTSPLALLGFPRERLVARMVLVLETVPKVQELVSRRLAHLSGPGSLSQRLAGTTRVILDMVLAEAEQQPVEKIMFSPAVSIPWYQWFYPIMVAAIFQILR